MWHENFEGLRSLCEYIYDSFTSVLCLLWMGVGNFVRSAISYTGSVGETNRVPRSHLSISGTSFVPPKNDQRNCIKLFEKSFSSVKRGDYKGVQMVCNKIVVSQLVKTDSIFTLGPCKLQKKRQHILVKSFHLLKNYILIRLIHTLMRSPPRTNSTVYAKKLEM